MSESRETIAAISGSASDTRELGKALGQALGAGRAGATAGELWCR